MLSHANGLSIMNERHLFSPILAHVDRRANYSYEALYTVLHAYFALNYYVENAHAANEGGVGHTGQIAVIVAIRAGRSRGPIQTSAHLSGPLTGMVRYLEQSFPVLHNHHG